MNVIDEVVQLSFQVFNEPHTFSVDEINKMFHFPTLDVYSHHSELFACFPEYDEQSWWKYLTEEREFVSSSAEASSYIHPAM